MLNKNILTGKTGLVTGSSRGIGKAIAIMLANLGADIAVNYHSNKNDAEQVKSHIEKIGRKSIVIQADVSKNSEVKKMINEISESIGEIEILINNAAIGEKRSFEDITEEDWDKTINTNLKSVFLITQAAIPSMIRNKWGRIINISSGAAFTGGLIGPHYTASKAGIIGLTRYYSSQLVKSGITVNAIAPALIETDMVKNSKLNADILPVKRFGTVDEIAITAELLIRNSFITGQVINVNGGLYF